MAHYEGDKTFSGGCFPGAERCHQAATRSCLSRPSLFPILRHGTIYAFCKTTERGIAAVLRFEDGANFFVLGHFSGVVVHGAACINPSMDRLLCSGRKRCRPEQLARGNANQCRNGVGARCVSVSFCIITDLVSVTPAPDTGDGGHPKGYLYRASICACVIPTSLMFIVLVTSPGYIDQPAFLFGQICMFLVLILVAIRVFVNTFEFRLKQATPLALRPV